MTSLVALAASAAALRLPEWHAVSDETLLELQAQAGELRRRADALVAEIAGEVARRSTREAAYGGLAQRLGARTPERLVQKLTGVSGPDARSLVAVGRLDDSSPIGVAVRNGVLTVGQASAIAAGLGAPSERTPESLLSSTAETLIESAHEVTVEDLRMRARQARDDLDASGIAEREEELRQRRYLRLFPQDDGMTRLVGLLDPESAALVSAVVDAGTSPRRGGPRFTTEEGKARYASIGEDPRSTEQLALDTVLSVLEVGRTADTSVLGPTGAPVQVLIAERDLRSGEGPATIEGQPIAVSAETARRRICADGYSPIVVDPVGRRAIDLGHSRRLFSARQRRMISARDGGCLIPDCPRPPGWCEAHHIHEWGRGGATDVDDGVLLCRFHHLMVHNNGWRIVRDANGYWLVPPPDLDPVQRRIQLPSKNPILARVAG